MNAWKAALPRWLDFEKAIHTGTNTSRTVVSANSDSYLLKNEDFSSKAFFSVWRKVSVTGTQNDKWPNNEKGSLKCWKCCNTNRCLQVSVEAGFSLIDSVIFSRILSHCDVPYKDMYFLFQYFEIIPTMMHLWCFSSAEKYFFFGKCPLCRHPLPCKWNSSLPLAPRAVLILLSLLVQPWGHLVSMSSACCWVSPLAPFSVRAIKGKPVASPG